MITIDVSLPVGSEMSMFDQLLREKLKPPPAKEMTTVAKSSCKFVPLAVLCNIFEILHILLLTLARRVSKICVEKT